MRLDPWRRNRSAAGRRTGEPAPRLGAGAGVPLARACAADRPAPAPRAGVAARWPVAGAVALSALAGAADLPAPVPRLGEPAHAAAIAAWDRDVMPSGAGLPPGSGSAGEGAPLFAERCAACHGPQGIGGSAEELAGARMTLTSDWPDKTIGTYWPYATTLFDFIRRSMPMDAPGSLSDAQVYALTAYLLWRNGIIDADQVLDAGTLAAVRMPNRDGFIRTWP